MFVRKKRNRSDNNSVSVVFKRTGVFKEVHRLGLSSDSSVIQRMYNEGCEWIALYGGQQLIDFDEQWRKELTEAEATAQTIADVKEALPAAKSKQKPAFGIIGWLLIICF